MNVTVDFRSDAVLDELGLDVHRKILEMLADGRAEFAVGYKCLRDGRQVITEVSVVPSGRVRDLTRLVENK